MNFAQANNFMLLYLVLGIVLFFWWMEKRYQEKKVKFVSKALTSKINPDFDPLKRILKLGLIVLVFIFAIISLARPQWGYELREVKRKGIDILIVVDVSKSMLTQDVKPNRLERTKLAVKDLIKMLKGDRVGLLAFSGDAFLVCPLTVDYNGFLLSLNDLDTRTISKGGTNIAVAIEKAVEAYDKDKNNLKSIIIVTDGDNLEGDPIKQAKMAKEKGVKVYTIGIGTKSGELIKVPNGQGSEEYLKDSKGNYVKSRLNESLLKEIADVTNAAYFKSAGSRFGLVTIYEQELSKVEKRDFESKIDKKYYERFQVPLLIAFLLLLIETCLTSTKRFFKHS